MSRSLRHEVETEFRNLRLTLDHHRDVVDACKLRSPTSVELDALAVSLHSFYLGFENIFKRIALAIDGVLPKGPFSHIKLLESMAVPTDNRRAVISTDLETDLLDLLNFRHVFRHAYAYDLKWTKMKHLVFNADETLAKAAKQIASFIDEVEQASR